MSAQDRLMVFRWSVRQNAARVANRWWDLVGRAAGFCMADAWQPARATYGGAKHRRCGKLRKVHAGGDVWHRSGDVRWRTGGPGFTDRAVTPGVEMVGLGDLPRWLRGRHYPVGTRRRDRLAVRMAFERIRAVQRSVNRTLERLDAVAREGVVPQDWRTGAIPPFGEVPKLGHLFVGVGEKWCRAVVGGPTDRTGGFTSTDPRDQCRLPRSAHPTTIDNTESEDPA